MNGFKYILDGFGISESMLSKQLRINQNIIYQWKKGIRPIPEKALNELSDMFGIPERFFLEISDSDIKELVDLISDGKFNCNGTRVFFEYKQLMERKKKLISILNSVIGGEHYDCKTLSELNEHMRKELHRLEMFLLDGD